MTKISTPFVRDRELMVVDAEVAGPTRTAIGEEHGYWLRVAELSVLDVATSNFALTVFPLGSSGYGWYEQPFRP